LDTKRHFGEGEEVVLYLSVAGKQGQKGFSLGSLGSDCCTKGLGWLGLKNIFSFSKALAAKSSQRLIKTSSLWTHVVHQKYISPLSILDWIRTTNKSSMGISIIWKALIKDFDLVGNGLVWRVGSGRLVRLGLDPWSGCQLGHLLSAGIRHRLAQGGFYYLAQVGDPLQTNMWHQGWMSRHMLGLLEEDYIHWNRYTQALHGCFHSFG
jgi:hypothetical protein